MTEHIMKFLSEHSSVRQFTNQDISIEDERKIIEIAQRAPTSSNLQAYSIISIRDKTKKHQLAALSGNQSHVAECPLFLVFCGDLHRLNEMCQQRGYPCHSENLDAFLVATVDAALVAGRALMAAQALGMGGVMVGAIRVEAAQVSSMLALPHLVYPLMGMSLGYPKEPIKVKPRLPLDAIYFHEQYQPENIESAIKKYDSQYEQLGFFNGRETQPEKYPDFKGTYSWSEHSARRMADDSPRASRPQFRVFLEKRGYLLK